MELSWIKQLADDSNQSEAEKQENERRKKEEERLMALATVPFVEKLFKLVQSWCDEFNKYSIYPDLRITVSRLTKKSRGPESTAALEEIAYFTFTRKSWMFGVRGINGIIDFVELPVTEGAASLSMKLDELGMDSVYKLSAKVEPDRNDGQKKQVLWTLKDEVMDGPRLGSLCQHFFTEFVKRTND